jgi:prepilin-type N-terminal cleavage/methylation domain-containing protein
MDDMNTKRNNSGFTLIEVLTIMLVVAVLASVGLPGMTRMLEGNRLSSNTNRLVSSLYAARSEAVKRNISTVICTRNTAGDACGGADAKRKDGWIVFVDTDGDGVRDANEDLLNVVEKLDTGMEFAEEARINITFSGDGMVNSNGNADYGEPGHPSTDTDAVNFQLDSDHESRVICLGSIGSIRTCNPNDSSQVCHSTRQNCR